MADLILDTTALRDLDDALHRIVDTLDGAERMSRTTADACGDGHLAEVLVEFADDWEDTRADMLDAVRSISDAVHLISETFEAVDESLVRSLLGAR